MVLQELSIMVFIEQYILVTIDDIGSIYQDKLVVSSRFYTNSIKYFNPLDDYGSLLNIMLTKILANT